MVSDSLYNAFINKYEDILRKTINIKQLYDYQRVAGREIIESLDKGKQFIIVSLPTGSGKTLLETLTAYYSLKKGYKILVIEPTKYLCDQMYDKVWSKIFGEITGKEYEGLCDNFLEPGKKIIISTPQTARKCIEKLNIRFETIIIDEVHHAFGNRYYEELIIMSKPVYVIGFTALLYSEKKFRLGLNVVETIGNPHMIMYDFKKLANIDPNFDPPRAIADLYEADFDEDENKIYEQLTKSIMIITSKTKLIPLFFTPINLISYLRRTLPRYGRKAYCETYRKVYQKFPEEIAKYIGSICVVDKPSHKARVLIEVLKTYNVSGNKWLKPVLIFTSRKKTAYEYKEIIIREKITSSNRIAVFTSDLGKEERKKLLNRIRNGEIDIIISTLVGEEGVDIPEAGLLVMSDIPVNPLRFYQRIGRLIRVSSPSKIKYLVIISTPYTDEYDDLGKALHRLYLEGVDLSYVIINIDSIKGLFGRIYYAIREICSVRNEKTIPYSELLFGRAFSIYNYLREELKKLKEVREEAQRSLLSKNMGINECIDFLIDINLKGIQPVKGYFLPCKNSVIREYIKDFLDKFKKNKYEQEIRKLLLSKKLAYIYDETLLSEFLSDKFTKKDINIKMLLRLFSRLLVYEEIDNVIKDLNENIEKYKKELDDLIGKDNYSIFVFLGKYVKRQKRLHTKLRLLLKINDEYIQREISLVYYDIPPKNKSKEMPDNKLRELIEKNLRAIGYATLIRLVNMIIEERIRD